MKGGEKEKNPSSGTTIKSILKNANGPMYLNMIIKEDHLYVYFNNTFFWKKVPRKISESDNISKLIRSTPERKISKDFRSLSKRIGSIIGFYLENK